MIPTRSERVHEPVIAPMEGSQFEDISNVVLSENSDIDDMELPDEDDVEIIDLTGAEEDTTSSTTVLTSGVKNPLTTGTLFFIAVLPEYPKTSYQGYTYVVNIDPQRRTPEMVQKDCLQIQYCRKQLGPIKPTVSPFFACPAIRLRYKCTGVKHCEHLDNMLRTSHHSEVTDTIWDMIKSVRLNNFRSEPDPVKRNTIGLFYSIQERFQKSHACLFPTPDCGPIVECSKHETISGVPSWSIKCKLYSSTSRQTGHFFQHLSSKYDPNTMLLLLSDSQSILDYQEKCGVILGTKTKLRTCDINHPQGPGRLQHTPCSVLFDILIPKNVQEVPYYTFTSTGCHTHPPPPPSKTPEALVQEIVALIHRVNDPSMTAGSFLRSPILQELCRKYNKPTFYDIHASLSNMDWLSQVIYKEKLILYPQGQDLAGVEFERTVEDGSEDGHYIREIYQFDLGTIIITMSDAQAKIFINLSTFQVDLSFKRVTGGYHELIFAFFNEQHGKLFTLARIYINSERRRVYQKSFQLLFKHLSLITKREVRWKHLHNTGFIGFTVDMDGKQMAGLGRYLSGIDPATPPRPWQWHLQNTIRFCEVHFRRGVVTATAGIDTTTDWVRDRMYSLLTAQNWSDYCEICDQLVANETPSVANWAIHKRNKVIASGLNRSITLIALNDWNLLESTSNHVESAANKSYSFGKKLRLLCAIKAGRELDMKDVAQWYSRDDRGVRHSYRSSGVVSRYNNNLARQKRKRTRSRSVSVYNSDDDDDVEQALLLPASSSGVVRSSSLSKRRSSPALRVRTSQPQLPRVSASESDSPTLTTSSQPVQMPIRSPSASQSLQRQSLYNNLELQSKQAALEIREKEASVRKQELENRLLQLQVERLEKEMQGGGD